MKVVVLINAAAGTAARSAGGTLQEELRKLFIDAGAEVDVRGVPGGELTEAARRAVAQGCDIVVAGGGDGTINAVASGLVDGATPLGVLPLGTLNHFAKAIGMPLTLPEAARAIVSGEAQPVDVGDVNGHIFLNNSSIGIYPAMVEDRDRLRLSRNHGKWVAMMQASLRVFRRFPLLDVRLATDNEQLRRKTSLVFVGNNKYELNLLRLGGRSCLDSGELSVYLANCATRWAMVKLAFRALVGRLNQSRDFETNCLSKLEVHTGRHKLSVALDGEVLRMSPPLVYRSRSKALRVVFPPPTAADGADTK